MKEFEFERSAMKGEPLPLKLDIADSCLYIALKNLYAMYRSGLIARKDAVEEKQRLVYNWARDKSKLDFLNRESDALKNKIGAASAKYAESRTLSNADALYAAFYNLPVDWRSKK